MPANDHQKELLASHAQTIAAQQALIDELRAQAKKEKASLLRSLKEKDARIAQLEGYFEAVEPPDSTHQMLNGAAAVFRTFPKGDARRYFTVLLTTDALGGAATTHRIAKLIEGSRAEIQRALIAASLQFGVTYQRAGAAYVITSWGVLDKHELETFIKSVV